MVLEQRLYDLLGVATDDSCENIRKVYHKLARKYHPDKNKDIDDEIFKSIRHAHEILKDKTRRAIYDSEGEEAINRYMEEERKEETNEETRNKETTIEEYELIRMHYNTTASLEELYSGSLNERIYATLICKLCEGGNYQCKVCGGEQITDRIRVDLSKFSNVPNGGELVEKHGFYDNSIKPAVFILKVVEEPQFKFIREGFNLITRLSISFIESLTHFEAIIPIPGHRPLYIKKQTTTQDKEKWILKGCGLPFTEGGIEKGDIIVFCRVQPPPAGFYNRTSPQFFLNVLEPSPSTPDFGETETTTINLLYQANRDSFEDLFHPVTANEAEYNYYFRERLE